MWTDARLAGAGLVRDRLCSQFGFEELGGVLSEIPTETEAATVNTISDVLRSGGSAAEVDWGIGAQDAIYGAGPVGDSNSTSDRLRGLAAAGEVRAQYPYGAGEEQAQQLIVGSGGGAYVTPADPEIGTGAVDWTRVLASVPATVGAISGAVVASGNALSRLAGVTPTTTVRGNPAPGGSTQPTLLQRLFGGGSGIGSSTPAAGAATMSSQVGMLATVGLVIGVGYLLVKGLGGRRR